MAAVHPIDDPAAAVLGYERQELSKKLFQPEKCITIKRLQKSI
jgi:hypothetical protein